MRLQFGALPYHFTKTGVPEFFLVTTRKTKRWMIPKGWPIKGLKAAKSAAREAYEEAGVRRNIQSKSVGFFTYDKRQEENGIIVSCAVSVFPLLVKRGRVRPGLNTASASPSGLSGEGIVGD